MSIWATLVNNNPDLAFIDLFNYLKDQVIVVFIIMYQEFVINSY